MLNLKVGQKVGVLKINNAARNLTGADLYFEDEVAEIKRKWFTLKDYTRHRFSTEDGMNDGKGYCSDYEVHESLEELIDNQRFKQKREKIRNFFTYLGGYGSLSKEQINEIYSIIFVEEKEVK